MRRTYSKDLDAIVGVRLPTATEALIDAAAREANVSRSEILRAAVIQFLDLQISAPRSLEVAR